MQDLPQRRARRALIAPCHAGYVGYTCAGTTKKEFDMKIRPVVSLLCAALVSGSAYAAEEIAMDKIEPAIKYRQNVMQAMGGLVGASAGRLRDGFTHGPDMTAIAAALQALSKDVAALFPEGTDFGETEAKAEVWSKPEEFKKSAANLEEKVDAFAAAVKTGDRAESLKAFKAMGDACKSCHEDFRKEQN